MRGVGGKPGWFWLFTLMGAFTVLSGFVFGFFLPDSFKNPTSCFLPKRRLFTDRELHILQTRVLIDDPMKGKKKSHIGLGAFRKAVSTSSPVVLGARADNHSSAHGGCGFTFSSASPIMVLNEPSIPTLPLSSIHSVLATFNPML